MKTERITVAASPAFKAFLLRQARLQNIDVSELIRRQFQPRMDPDAATLRLLTRQLREATQRANQTADAALQAVEESQARIRQLRAAAHPEAS